MLSRSCRFLLLNVIRKSLVFRGNYWDGGIADMAIWDTALTPTQVAYLYSGTTEITAQIDWDNDGSFDTAGDDITSDIISLNTSQGMYLNDPVATTAQTGQATIIVKNADLKYTPNFAGSPLYGKLLPNRPVRIVASGLVAAMPDRPLE